MEENKFRKDVADPNINVKNLNDIFDVDPNTGDIVNLDDSLTAVEEVNEMRKELKKIEDNLPDIDNIIVKNIERANEFLDKVGEQIMMGNLSASMIEACATLINAVTTAATSITGISYNNDVLEIRRGELAVREKKLTLDSIKNDKPISVQGDVNVTNQNLTMSREDLLRELRKP